MTNMLPSLENMFMSELLTLGLIVIIEWGTWGRSERDSLRVAARALGAAVELHYRMCSSIEFNVVVWRILPPIKRDVLDIWFKMFQAPTPEEMELFDKPLIEKPVYDSN
jgi:predicted kinase